MKCVQVSGPEVSGAGSPKFDAESVRKSILDILAEIE